MDACWAKDGFYDVTQCLCSTRGVFLMFPLPARPFPAFIPSKGEVQRINSALQVWQSVSVSSVRNEKGFPQQLVFKAEFPSWNSWKWGHFRL